MKSKRKARKSPPTPPVPPPAPVLETAAPSPPAALATPDEVPYTALFGETQDFFLDGGGEVVPAMALVPPEVSVPPPIPPLSTEAWAILHCLADRIEVAPAAMLIGRTQGEFDRLEQAVVAAAPEVVAWLRRCT